MIKYTILGSIIVLIGFFAYFQTRAFNFFNPEQQVKSDKMQITDNSTNEVNRFKSQSKANNTTSGKNNVTQNFRNGSEIIPEKDPLSPYYLKEKEYQKVETNGMFEGKSKEKLFEIRRKMIDMGFDAKQLSEDLAHKLKAAPNGKLSKEEFFNLLPEEIATDFEEMMDLQRE